MYLVQRESAPIPGVGRIISPRFAVCKTQREAEAVITRVTTSSLPHHYAHGKPTFVVKRVR